MVKAYPQKLKPRPPRTDHTPYKWRRDLYGVILAVASLVFIAAASVAYHGQPAGWEYTWLKAVNDLPNSWKIAAVIITYFGSGWAIAAAVVVAFFLRLYRLAWRLTLSVGLALGLGYLAKAVVDRGRPEAFFTNLHFRAHETGMGFPSLHTVAATVIALTFLPYIHKQWRWLVPAMILGVGLSRLYLGVHLPLDVIGGMALGTIVVALCRVLPQPLRILLKID